MARKHSRNHRRKMRVPSAAHKMKSSVLKVPYANTKLPNMKDRNIIFRFDCVDLDPKCPWSLADMNPKQHKDVLLKLKDFEEIKVKQLQSYRNYVSYNHFDQCPNKRALQELSLYSNKNIGVIGRFRLSGRDRLYGFMNGNEFHLLWWDPNHEIWPSIKKYT